MESNQGQLLQKRDYQSEVGEFVVRQPNTCGRTKATGHHGFQVLGLLTSLSQNGTYRNIHGTIMYIPQMFILHSLTLSGWWFQPL